MENNFPVAAMINRVAHTMHGIVSAVDPTNHAVKVLLQPENIETGWIADAAMTQVGDLRISCPCAPGTHVVLQPIEGDGEHWVVTGVVYDAVMTPIISPATGEVARPGEFLLAAGCGDVPQNGQVGETAGNTGTWWHVTSQGLFCGIGDTRLTIQGDSIVWRVGGVQAVFSERGLEMMGGDIVTDQHSLNQHRHPFGQEMTGLPVG
ncbi:baseplate assembly protein [Kozakia baliensis]|uniref:baseplate assembly protein n=1 Tax=Kozakia baliensis TaxID=153496 RepID=UPI00087A6163|nr:baseplate assembly protein [Kozakia baliensis]AOX21349.1 baseplate assembly protein [Kozakia baliensis]